jgi:hypothetical protein
MQAKRYFLMKSELNRIDLLALIRSDFDNIGM